jgi:hypothetical protein
MVGMSPSEVRTEITSLLNGTNGADAPSSINGAHRPAKPESHAAPAKSHGGSKSSKAKKR